MTLVHQRRRQHYLVCRNGDETEHVGSLRPPDGEISKLAGEGRRKNPAHLCRRGRTVVYPSPGQRNRPGRDKGVTTPHSA
jgi:hypothetical protein